MSFFLIAQAQVSPSQLSSARLSLERHLEEDEALWEVRRFGVGSY